MHRVILTAALSISLFAFAQEPFVIQGKIADYAGAEGILEAVTFAYAVQDNLTVGSGEVSENGSFTLELTLLTNNQLDNYDLNFSNEYCRLQTSDKTLKLAQASILNKDEATLLPASSKNILGHTETGPEDVAPTGEIGSLIYASTHATLTGICSGTPDTEISFSSVVLTLEPGWNVVKYTFAKSQHGIHILLTNGNLNEFQWYLHTY